MKRLILLLLAYAVGGAIFNVAVAICLALMIQFDWRQANGYDHYTNWLDREDGFKGYTGSRYRRFGAERTVVSYSSGFDGMPGRSTVGFRELIRPWAVEFTNVPELVGRDRAFFDDVELRSSLVDARGWPWLAIWGGMKIPSGGQYSVDGKPVQVSEQTYWFLLTKPRTPNTGYSDIRGIPIRPIWPGFALNTIFYAAILWLLFAAPGLVRRGIRIMRGRCAACGYDLRGHPPEAEYKTCPECGEMTDATGRITP